MPKKVIRKARLKSVRTKLVAGKGAKIDFHVKIAANRGAEWRKNLKLGRLEVQLRPSSLRLARLEKKLDQGDVAKKLDISQGTYCGIERGLRLVKKDVVVRIAKLLDKPAARLFKASTKDKFLAIIKDQRV